MHKSLSRTKEDEEKSIAVKVKGGYSTLRVREIMYVDYRNHVVSYHLANGEVISTSTIRNKEEIPVSKSHYSEVAEKYMDYRL